jgi:hypothetical protein
LKGRGVQCSLPIFYQQLRQCDERSGFDPPPAFTTGLGRRLARRCLPRIIIITMNIFYRMLLNGMPLRGALVAVALSLVTVAALGALTIRAVPLPHSQLPDVSRLQLELR